MAEPSWHAAAESVAVIGLACRFPDADDPPTLLDTILTGRRAFRRLPPGRLDLADYDSASAGAGSEHGAASHGAASHGPASRGARAGLIEGWQFDRESFRIPAQVYAAADPAHWLALETAARALAAAGFPGGTGLDRDRIGVVIGNTLAGDDSRANGLGLRWPYVRRVLAESLFAGDVRSDRARRVLRHAAVRYLTPLPRLGDHALADGVSPSIPDRISSYFGFRGGSQAVDSACASSLQAVASACAALTARDIDVALAGGVDVSLDPLELIGLAAADPAAAGGDMRIYDENPTGYLPGEGCGVVVLMRTAQARAAGLPVYAEIVGWGTSAGGMPGVVASDASSQLLALRRAYERAGLDPCEVQLIEGHGSGTAAGDEAELTALAELRADAREAAALGSIKANIGHAKAAAGAAGLIKVVLALGTGVIPPTTGVVRPHPLLRGAGAAFWLPEVAEEWPAGSRLAGVSAMGVGGVNVHLVLRNAPGRGSRYDRVLRALPRLARAGSGKERAACTVRVRDESRREVAYLLHAPGRRQLAAALSRVAELATWLSDAEMTDLACQLGRDARNQGPVRVAIVASRQEELARLAAEAATLLPGLTDGLLATRPGIFAADNADGRVTLLLSDEAGASAGPGARLLTDVPLLDLATGTQLSGTQFSGTQFSGTRAGDTRVPDPRAAAADLVSSPAAIGRSLAALRWLETLEVSATAAVGHGLGEIAGLAWAGVLSEADVTEIAALRAEFLSGPAVRILAPPGRHAGDRHPAQSLASDPLGLLRAAIAQFRFGPPRRRLISTRTGRELASASEVIDLICGGFAADDRRAEAVIAGAEGATLLIETGPGRLLASTAARSCRVPTIALDGAGADHPGRSGSSQTRASQSRPDRSRTAQSGAGRPSARRPEGGRAGADRSDADAAQADRSAAAQTWPGQVWAGAALFAAGAVGQVQPLLTGQPARPIDIWRDRVFITGPSQGAPEPQAAGARRPSPDETPAGGSAHPALTGTRERPPAPAASAASARTAVPLARAGDPLARAGNPVTPADASVARTGEPPAPATGWPSQAVVPLGRAAESPAHATPSSVHATPTSGQAEPPAGQAEPPVVSQHGGTGAGGRRAGRPAAGGQSGAAHRAAGWAGLGWLGTSRNSARGAGADVPGGTASAGRDGDAGTDDISVSAGRTSAGRTGTGRTGTGRASGDRTGRPGPGPDGTVPAAEAAPTGAAAAGAPATGAAAAGAPGRSGADARAGVQSWARCFTEELQPAARPSRPAGDQPWRIRVAGSYPFRKEVGTVFDADPAADRALAVIGDPAAPGALQVALTATQDGLATGRLTVITTSPGLTGLIATLHAEHPEVGVTVLRVPASADGLRAARRYAHAEAGEFRELVITEDGAAREPVLVPRDLPGGGDFPLGPSDVALVSRSSGGAALALAQVLACCGAAVAVVGRAEPGEDSEVVAGLEELRLAGARIAYEVVDAADPTDMALAVQRVERRLGPVTAVAHAVGPAAAMPLAGLTQQDLGAHLGTERTALHNLLGLVKTERLRLVLTFGSVAGHYGLPRQGLLAAASTALADQAEALMAGVPGCHALHVQLPGWSGGGLGDRPALAESMAAAGTAAITVSDAARLLLKALATPGLPGRIAVHGRTGVPGPGHAGPPADAPQQPLAGRFLQDVVVHYPGIELVCDARLSLATDPYLADYRMDGLPVLPPVMAMEALAQAAAALAGRPLRRATAVAMAAPVVLPSAGGQARIRVCALAEGGKITAALRCEESGFAVDHVRAEFTLDGAAAAGAAGTAGEPLAVPGAAHAVLRPGAAGLVDGAELYGPVCFQSGRFRRIAILPEVTSRSCRALARGAEDRAWFSRGQAGAADPAEAAGVTGEAAGAGLLLGSPGLNDTALQVLQACAPDRRVWLESCASVSFSGRLADGAVEIRAIATAARNLAAAASGGADRADGAAASGRASRTATGRTIAVPAQALSPDQPAAAPELTWDVDVIDSAGEALVTWRGVRVREAGLLPRNSAWPPSLLSVYLERGAVGLGLDPGLRMTVQCGQPDAGLADADGPPASGEQPASGALPAGDELSASDELPAGTVPQQRSGDGAGTPLAAGPLASIPRASMPADSGPLAAIPRLPAEPGDGAVAAGTGLLAGFTLEARGVRSAACGWVVADPQHPVWPASGDDLAATFSRLCSHLSEPPVTSAARLQAVAACLAMAQAPEGTPVTFGRVTADGWALLEAAGTQVACVVVEISGVPCPVAIAITTGAPRRDSRPGRDRRAGRGGGHRVAARH